MNVEVLLNEVITADLERLKNMEVGAEEYDKTVNNVTKLMDRFIEIDKLNIEHEEKIDIQKTDTELKLKQMKDERIDRWVRNGITFISVGGGLILTYWGSKKSWKFEETGTITSTAGREFMKKLFHLK